MSKKPHKKCPPVNIPQTDETLQNCDRLIYSECIIEGEKTQEEINGELLQRIEDLEQLVYNLTQQINEPPQL